jgi:2-dehydropantoate 2-reductase
MKIVMMGSGGVGGYFGGRLAAGGADVHFVARGAHLEAMRSQGLTIEGGPAPFHLPQVPATNDPSSIDVADFVLIAVKLWDTAAAIEQVKPIVGPHTTVISFQNGVLKDRYLIDAFGVSRVMGGVGYVATTIDRPGVIRQTGPMQRLLFGEFDGTTSERGQRLLEACLKGGIAAQLSADIRREIWQKYVFLVGLSGTTTTIRKPIAMSTSRGAPVSRMLSAAAMREPSFLSLAVEAFNKPAARARSVQDAASMKAAAKLAASVSTP